MKKIIFTALAVSCMSITSIYAQVSFGPKVGLNLSTVHFKYQNGDNGDGLTNNVKAGFQLGGMMNAQINDYFAIRPELLFSQAGYNTKYNYVSPTNTSSVTINAQWGNLVLPVNFVGQLPISENFKIQAFAGPYASLLLGGKQKYEYVFTSTISGNDSGSESNKIKGGKEPDNYSGDNAYYNPLDLGFNFGLGFQARSFVFSAGYKLGLTNLNSHYENSTDESNRDKETKVYNRGFNFGVAYLFGGK